MRTKANTTWLGEKKLIMEEGIQELLLHVPPNLKGTLTPLCNAILPHLLNYVACNESLR